MSDASTGPLKRTPFYDLHVAAGAKMVAFAGFEMPIQYPGGITAEHNIVRNGCGVFDVSHMGEFIIKGKQAIDFVTYVTTNDVAALADGQVHYSGILTEQGTFVDDCLVYRYAADHLMMVVNGSNKDKDLKHIQQYVGRFDCVLTDVSDDIGLLAVQGPKAQEILQAMTPKALDEIKYYWFTETTVAGIPMTLSRTGYTGEDGFELYFDPAHAATIWNALLADSRVTPTGLGCRDSLRLEMGMALYGNDIDDTVTPLEANLGWITKLAKGDFVGREALVRQKEAGIPRKLVGFTFAERAIPRHGYPVFCNGAPSGSVCSGTMSPSLGIPIGTCYLPTASAAEGSAFEVEIRGKRVAATVVKPPFYKDASHL